MVDIEKLSYEKAFRRLEELVAQLESGELSLERSVELYEMGQRLAGHCQSLLENAELRVRQVEEQDGGDKMPSTPSMRDD